MKAQLIKKAEGWYNLYQDKIGIGSTYPELQGYKLSKQNCDEIFGVTDVEKLAEERFGKSLHHANSRSCYKEGFNKAMELNEHKLFTLNDILRAISFGQGMDLWKEEEQVDKFIESLHQPTEIEVEIEMVKVVDETKVIGAVKGVKGSGDKITTYKSVPKLDADGCIILRKSSNS
jgi:hypothetical protein